MKKSVLILIIVLLLTGCVGKSNKSDGDYESIPSEETNPVATLTMANGNIIEIELYPEIAPNTVNNFIELANSGFYDGLKFHRVISGFMIQGGDPMGTGMGGPGYAIKGEFNSNDFKNPVNHERGIISMARSQANDSAGSQFFIVHQDSAHLNGEYAAFGKVIEGMDHVDAIAGVKTHKDMPEVEQVIQEIRVDLKDYSAKPVEKI